MARRSISRRPPEARRAPRAVEPTDRTASLYLAATLLCGVVCFFPVLKYFFAQDDFSLMLAAWRDGWGAVAEYFQSRPGMFRPLTKAVYFGAMHGMFGLNPLPFHVVSLAVHLVNCLLVYELMKRLRVSSPAAVAAAMLFALDVAFFHVIGWISCIQQLLGQMFMLSALVWGMDYGRQRRARDMWSSVVAYVLALMSMEQTFGVPVILVLYAWLLSGEDGGRVGLRGGLRTYAVHLVVLAAYLLFMGAWKTPPRTGAYALTLGGNVAVNLMTYLGWSVQFGATLPRVMQSEHVPWSISHLVVLLLVAYQIARGRWREVTFGMAYFLIAVSPVLFLARHTFYLHTYIPMIGVLYLIAVLVDDVLALRWLRGYSARRAFLGAVLLAVSCVSFLMVRRNDTLTAFGSVETAQSFVRRRGMIARNMYDHLVALKPFRANVKRVYLVYAREENVDEAKWNNDNVMAATGWGSMIPLVYGRPDLEVVFLEAGASVERSELSTSDVYFYDDLGNCFPMDAEGQE
jgi:hypothetical protein